MSKPEQVLLAQAENPKAKSDEKVYQAGGEGWTVVVKVKPQTITVSRMGPTPTAGISYVLDKKAGIIRTVHQGGGSVIKPDDPSYIGNIGAMIRNASRLNNPEVEKVVLYLNSIAANIIPEMKISVPTEGQLKRSIELKVEVKGTQKVLTVFQWFPSNSGIVTRTLNLNTGMAREFSYGSSSAGKFKPDIIDSMLSDVQAAITKDPADKNLQLIRYYLGSVKENK